MRIRDITIAEYAHIRVSILSGIITAMLILDSLAITLTVGMLDGANQPLRDAAIGLLIFATGSGVLLFLLAQRYVESVTYRFINIEEEQMKGIARVAKRFFLPFLMCLIANIFLSVLGIAFVAILLLA